MRKLLIILGLLLLLTSSMASATLLIRSITGSDEIPGYRAVQDSIAINLSSTTGGITINGAAANCPNEEYTYLCAFNDEQNVSEAVYDLVNSGGDTATVSIKIDNSIGPIIYTLTNTAGNITLDYDVTDTAYNGGAGCSGLAQLDIFWMGSNTDTIDFNATPANCNYKGSRVLGITESGIGEFYIKATDKLGNEKESEKKNITLDVDAPVVLDNSLSIFYQGTDNELGSIAQGVEFGVDVIFSIVEDNLSTISVDARSLHDSTAINIPYRNIHVPLSSCKINITDEGKTYTCIIPGLRLRINGETVWINVTATDINGNKATNRIEKTFDIDNDKSDVTMTTNYCDSQDRCYVKNGLNQINIHLTKDNFDNKNVFFQVGGVNARVNNCTGGECTGIVLVTCSSGPVQARIITTGTSISQDDAGNKLNPYTTQFYCDNTPPIIKNTTWLSDSTLANNLIMTGKTFTLIVDVQEADSEELNATAWLDKMKNATEQGKCDKYSDTKINCTWTISNAEDGPYDANVLINISDTIGNMISKTETIRVLGLVSNNETPTGLKASYASRMPSGGINRITLRLAGMNGIPYYAYAYYDVFKKNPSADIQLLSQKLSVSDCVYKDSQGTMLAASQFFSEIKIADKFMGIGSGHRIDLTFDPANDQTNAMDDSFTILCNISAYQRVGKNVLSNPQILIVEMPFTLRNSQLSAPGEQYIKKIQDTEKSLNGSTQKLITDLNKKLVFVQKICDSKQFLDYAQLSGVVVQTAGMGLNMAFPGAGDTLLNTGDGIVKAIEKVDDNNWNPPPDRFSKNQRLASQLTPKSGGSMLGFLSQACEFLSCNLAMNKWGIDTMDSGVATGLENAAKDLPLGIGSELTDSLQSSDLKNSMAMSVMKLCLPGIVYNLNKYQQMQCEYLQCLKLYAATGLDVSQCDVMLASKTCAIYVGEAFELPFVRLGKNLFSNAGDLVRQSYGRGFAALITWVRDNTMCDKPSSAQVMLCHIPEAIQQYLSTQKKSVRATSLYYEDTRDFCGTAGCVGPACYENDAKVLGVLLPRYMPTAQQSAEMQNMYRYGSLYDTSYHITNAYYAPDPTTRQNNIIAWNKEIARYNTEHNYKGDKAIPPIPENADDAALARYANNFNVNDVAGGTTNNGNTNNPTPNTPPIDPYIAYANAISQQTAIYTNIYENDAYNFGLPRTQPENHNIQDVQRQASKPTQQQTFANLDSMLPGENNIYATQSEGQAKSNGLGYYYFDGNTLMYDTKTVCVPPCVISPKDVTIPILTYDSEGLPDDFNNEIMTNPEYDALTKRANELWNEKRNLEVADKDRQLKEDAFAAYVAEKHAYTLVTTFMSVLGFQKFMTSEYWIGKLPGAQFVTSVADSLDTDRWKNSLCNPDNGLLYSGGDQPEGTVYQCSGSGGTGCRIVLTFGAEYQKYIVFNATSNTNKTKYLYTVSYFVGPVRTDVKYNIKLKGITGAGKDPLMRFNTSYIILPADKYDQNADVFLLNNSYSQICFVFQKDFPNQGDGPLEKCRTIKENVFNTGRPLTEEEMTNQYSGDSTSSTYSGGFWG